MKYYLSVFSCLLSSQYSMHLSVSRSGLIAFPSLFLLNKQLLIRSSCCRFDYCSLEKCRVLFPSIKSYKLFQITLTFLSRVTRTFKTVLFPVNRASRQINKYSRLSEWSHSRQLSLPVKESCNLILFKSTCKTCTWGIFSRSVSKYRKPFFVLVHLPNWTIFNPNFQSQP